MTVKQILDQKGRNVVTVSPKMGTEEAVRFLADNKIGAVIVTGPGGKIAGILSERDIVRAVAAKGADALSAPISNIMTSKVTTCGEDHTINQVMELMTNGRFRHLPVEKDGSLVGVISIGDVVRRRIEDVEREAEDIKAYIAG
ncbi:CBS domain-containing protein [uncultured Hoeflea sp.]|jgi:CBS domain-containing protein|uniref:CBS domain-containing protein n=1 Tax=uncultured Hoeflea sp. TaxID=538666 RepID=UPI0030DA1912|tara:strand:+ start:1087 stop:1515 length:429 start_codon:yes stop_codon:yes gene_type:complete